MRRWEVTSEEWRRINAARSRPMTVRDALKLVGRRPRLAREVVRDVLANAKGGVWQSSSLVWLLDSERVRREVPDAARGIGFADEKPFLEALLPLVTRESVALDVGGGDGRVSRHVAAVARAVVVSDPSATMLREAAENLQPFGNVSTHLSDGHTLRPLRDSSFDVAFAQGVLSYLEVNPGLALLDEIARVTRGGGHLVVNAFTMDTPEWQALQVAMVRESAMRGRFSGGLFRSYTEGQVEAMVTAAGFEVVATTYGSGDPLERRPYIVVGRRC